MRNKATVTYEVIYFQPYVDGGRWRRCNPIYRMYDQAFIFMEWLHRAGFSAIVLTTHELDIVGMPAAPVAHVASVDAVQMILIGREK